MEDLLGQGEGCGEVTPPKKALSGAAFGRNFHASDTHRFSDRRGEKIPQGPFIGSFRRDKPGGRSGLRLSHEGGRRQRPPSAVGQGADEKAQFPCAGGKSPEEGFPLLPLLRHQGEMAPPQAEAVVEDALPVVVQQRGFPHLARPAGGRGAEEDPHRRRSQHRRRSLVNRHGGGDRRRSPRGGGLRPPGQEGRGLPAPKDRPARIPEVPGQVAERPLLFPGLQHGHVHRPKHSVQGGKLPGSRDEPLHLLPVGSQFSQGRKQLLGTASCG